MSAKDYGLVPIKVNNFVHYVAKRQHDYLLETQEVDSSLITEMSTLILEYRTVSPEIFQQLMVPRIHCWGGPWKWLYIREHVRPVLNVLVENLNRSLPPRFIDNLSQGVNSSNVLSALILTKGLKQKLVFKVNHVVSNHGYRVVAQGSPSLLLKQ